MRCHTSYQSGPDLVRLGGLIFPLDSLGLGDGEGGEGVDSVDLEAGPAHHGGEQGAPGGERGPGHRHGDRGQLERQPWVAPVTHGECRHL